MIDEEIRNIERPKNTIVKSTKNSNIYMVIERVGCKYSNGKRIPINGHVVGHIIDGKYVKKEKEVKRVSARDILVLKYGNVAFADSVANSLLTDLKNVYNPKDANIIYTLALLRSSFGDIKDYQLQDKYNKSWASILYPNIPLSKNYISKFLTDLGASYDLIVKFMNNRIDSMVNENTKVLIDGMLKNNSSIVNSFSGFSYKGKIKGMTDISIMIALDYDKKEPLCSKVYKGNMPDFVNIKDFLEEYKIEKGIKIGDKGFPFERIENIHSDKKIGFLHPIKRNDSFVNKANMYENLNPLNVLDNTLLASKKYNCNNNLNYYFFKDLDKAAKEEKDYLKRNRDNLNQQDYAYRKRTFGSICFVSNIDIEIEDVYRYYEFRWEIELVFKMYKNIISLNTTRVHDDTSIIGTEFINFLATIITCKMKNKIKDKCLHKQYTYKDIIERLTDIIKYSSDEKKNNWRLCTMSREDKNILDTLCV